ncbi:Dystrophin [Nymphon striatum]|nr:Dystrophin [Nymphon striatum]
MENLGKCQVSQKINTYELSILVLKNNQTLVNDLFFDLRDGTKLLALLEILCGTELKREKGVMRLHHMNNVNNAIKFLEFKNVKLVNISSNDIVDGNAKLTLGLVWSIILHWQLRNFANSEVKINVKGTEIKDVKTFKYLGAQINEEGGTSQEITTQIQKANAAFRKLSPIWQSSTYSRTTKLKIFKSNVLPVLLYDLENWKITKAETLKLNSFQTRCLRRILKIFWPNTISNKDLLERTNCTNIDEQIMKRRWKWIGHILRKESKEDAKIALKWTPPGRRTKGRPRTTWRRMVEKERRIWDSPHGRRQERLQTIEKSGETLYQPYVHDVLKGRLQVPQQTNLERTLLQWCRIAVKDYESVEIRNFTTAWRDGLAFNALIHRFNPELFNFDDVISKDVPSRLKHAFTFANEHLGIDNLLEIEDVNTKVPDKKSIILYVMCFFEALSHHHINMEEIFQAGAVSISPPLSPSVKSPISPPLSPSVKSPISPKKGSVNLNSYQGILEDVLTWLLEAEGKLTMQDEICTDVEEVKIQFQHHEDFMLDLTSHQNKVGEVLQEGNHLISRGLLAVEEENEIQVQMSLLNNRWEDLRTKAMNRQTKLHEVLMELQQNDLNKLRNWLTETEDRISRIGDIGPSLDNLHEQLEQQKKLQEDLVKQQDVVNTISNLVVVIDENNPDGAFSDMEDQLAALGERWAHICRWTENHWLLLQDVSVKWRSFDETSENFLKWMNSIQEDLDEMKSRNVNKDSDPKLILEQVKKLQVS